MQHRKPSTEVKTRDLFDTLTDSPASLEKNDQDDKLGNDESSFDNDTKVVSTSDDSLDEAPKKVNKRTHIPLSDSEEDESVLAAPEEDLSDNDNKTPVKPAPVRRAAIKEDVSDDDKAPVKLAPIRRAAIKDDVSDDDEIPARKAPARAAPSKVIPAKAAPVRRAAIKDDVSDDDVIPTKAAPSKVIQAKAAPAKAAPVRRAAIKDDVSDDDAIPARKAPARAALSKVIPAKAAPIRRAAIKDNVSDDDEAPARKAPVRAAPARTNRVAAVVAADSDSEDVDTHTTQPNARKAPAATLKRRVVVADDELSASEEDVDPPKAPASKRKITKVADDQDDRIDIGNDTSSSKIAEILFPAVRSVLQELDLQEFFDEKGIEPNDVVKMIMAYEPPKTKKEAAACKFSTDVLQKVAAGKHRHNFPSDLKDKICLAHFAHNPPVGKDPYSCCGIKTTTGRVCPKHLKNQAGKTLDAEIKKTGFSLRDYVKKVNALAASWATKKLLTAAKVPSGNITTSKTAVISDEEQDDDNISDEELESHSVSLVPYKHGRKADNVMWHAETGAVLIDVDDDGAYAACIGIDMNHTGKKLKVKPSVVNTLTKLGWTVADNYIASR